MRHLGRTARRTGVIGALAAASVAFALLLSGIAPASAAADDRPGSTLAAPHAAPAVRPLSNLDDFSFESLDADYTLSRADDGTSELRVVETFVAVFPETDQNRGMRRLIPDTYNGQPLFPEFVSITDESGRARPAEVEQDDDVFSMTSRADDFVHGRQTYVFTYTLRNVTWRFPDTGEEFYWNVNGVDWAQPFGRVTATLHLADDVADAATGAQTCYRGARGSTETCAMEERGATITATAESIAPHQTMTIAVGFEDGTFSLFDSGYLASGWGWAQGVAGLGLVGAVGFAAWSRRRFLRDDPGRPTIIAEFAPPRQIDALESAVLLSKPGKAIPAEVLEQAIVGSIRILEGEPRRFGGTKLQAELIDPSRADGDGRMLLDGLFGPGAAPGAVFEFGRQDTRFSAAAQAILKAADDELSKRGLRRTVPVSARVWPIVVVGVMAALVIGFGVVALIGYVMPVVPLLLIFAAVIAVLAVAIMIAHRPLTAVGAEVRDHLAGLKTFIEWAEADRIRMLQSPAGAERAAVDVNDPRQVLRLYESLLPYAVVFGQEKEWSRQLAVLYASTAATGPVWYYGTHGFDATAFSSGIGTLSTAASSSSATSGGSSGGGSAGGGGGGGGGGGV
jgi:hypothetical protein